MADLQTVSIFSQNKDANEGLRQRATVAMLEHAINMRAGMAPSLSSKEAAEQQLAIDFLHNPQPYMSRFMMMFAIKANDAGLIDDAGIIIATDAQIRSICSQVYAVFCSFVSPSA